MEVTVLDVITQMSYVIPTIIAATCTLTAAIHGIFNITTSWVNHLISWIIAIATAVGFVACNGLDFGLSYWNYAIAVICGVITGASANGIYDWESVKAFFDSITNIFK